MTTIINLDALNTDSVTVKTIKVFEDEGVTYEMQPHAKAYLNSEVGRAELAAELGEPHLSAVMAMWGDAPTVFTSAEEPDTEAE